MVFTPLHLELADRINRAIHDDGLEPGARLNENQLAEQLGVSRTPIRAALEYLAGQGFVERQPHRGVLLLKRPPAPAAAVNKPDTEDDLLRRIAYDRRQGNLGDYVSEKELMEFYGLGRAAIRNALEKLADLGTIEPKLGYGWRFAESGWDSSMRNESYRFRLVIEPAAIREPSFSLAPGWASDMRERHLQWLRDLSEESSSVTFFEMNAAFHEGIAAASGNRFFHTAVQRQNRLRRLSNYDWKYGAERMQVNCREHLEMLDRMEAGDQELAALLMLRHLDVASKLRPR